MNDSSPRRPRGSKQDNFPIKVDEVGTLCVREESPITALVSSVSTQGVRFVHEEFEGDGSVHFVDRFVPWGQFDFSTSFPKESAPRGYPAFLLKLIDYPREEWLDIDLESNKAHALRHYLADQPRPGLLDDFYELLRACPNIPEEKLAEHTARLTEDMPPERVIKLMIPPPASASSSRSRWNGHLASVACAKIKRGECDRSLLPQQILVWIMRGHHFKNLQDWLKNPVSELMVELECRRGSYTGSVRQYGTDVLKLRP